MRPRALLLAFLLSLAGAALASADGPLVYVVQPGDTLSAIAQRHQTTPDAIARLNDLADPSHLRSGQKLTILSASEGEVGAADTAAPRVGPRRDARPQRVHIVGNGETLSGIAADYGTTVEALVKLNGLPSAQLISVGQRLILPEPPGPAPLATGRSVSYTVQPGDTLLDVALRYGTDARSVAVLNDLPATSWLWPGQQLTLPLSWQVAGAPAPALAKRIEVSIREQRVYAWQGKHLVYSLIASTGLPGYPTRRGRFTIQSKIPVAVSTGLNLEMPYWMGIYYAGPTENGFHALPINRTTRVKLWGGLIGRPVSYGCIVLRDGDMAALYRWAELGTIVDIHD